MNPKSGLKAHEGENEEKQNAQKKKNRIEWGRRRISVEVKE